MEGRARYERKLGGENESEGGKGVGEERITVEGKGAGKVGRDGWAWGVEGDRMPSVANAGYYQDLLMAIISCQE